MAQTTILLTKFSRIAATRTLTSTCFSVVAKINFIRTKIGWFRLTFSPKDVECEVAQHTRVFHLKDKLRPAIIFVPVLLNQAVMLTPPPIDDTMILHK